MTDQQPQIAQPAETVTQLPDTIRHQPCDTGTPRCGKPGRFYPAGWRCTKHQPRSHNHD